MSMVEELKKAIQGAQDNLYSRHDSPESVFLRDHGQALVESVEDAERWRKVRKAPLGAAGTPCVVMPKSERSGDFINGADADAAVDGMPWPVAPTFTVSELQELIVPFEIAHNVCGPDTEYGKGYGDACGDIVHSVNKIIDLARTKAGAGGGS